MPSPLLAAEAGNATQALPSVDLGAAWWNMAGGLILILGGLLVAYHLLKRFGPKSGLGMFRRGGLSVEGQLALGPRKQVVVVRFLNKVMVLGVTENQINLLTEVDDRHDPAAREDFSATLDTAREDDSP